MSGPAVQTRGLTKLFHDEARGEVRAVDGVDFDVAPGEILGLLGANGAGKTTTLRMLATVLQPSGGQATVAGHDVAREPERVRASLGFYSASTALYPRLTPRETLRFFARLNGVAREQVEPRVAELVAQFELGSYADTRVDKLSTGMKQKVSLARTLVHRPPVLIFDEPTVGLDVINALEMRRLIGGLRDEGACVLYSTHILSEAEKLCDRIAVLHAGRVLACDTLAALREATGQRYLEDIFVQLVGGDPTGAEAALD